MNNENIIEVERLKQYFRINENYTVKAVDGVSFGIKKGEIFGLAGESGCGKSTIARTMTGIYKPTEGTVYYEGMEASGKKVPQELKNKMQRELQIVFQDSAASLNPRMTIEKIIAEPLKMQNRTLGKDETTARVIEMLRQVSMAKEYLHKRPGELSGGQRQRVAIARSLMLDPKVIIADEPVASLDISIQAQIITLFQRLQKEKGFSFLFIAHDLSVLHYISDRIGVMFRGRLVEVAPTEELFQNPLHPYTKSLLSAIHIPNPQYERQKKMIYYDPQIVLGNKLTEVSKEHFVLAD